VFSSLDITEPLDFLIYWEDELEDAELSDPDDESEGTDSGESNSTDSED
jgi:hypothetical protein